MLPGVFMFIDRVVSSTPGEHDRFAEGDPAPSRCHTLHQPTCMGKSSAGALFDGGEDLSFGPFVAAARQTNDHAQDKFVRATLVRGGPTA